METWITQTYWKYFNNTFMRNPKDYQSIFLLWNNIFWTIQTVLSQFVVGKATEIKN